jgi:hypothetical protein
MGNFGDAGLIFDDVEGAVGFVGMSFLLRGMRQRASARLRRGESTLSS